MGLRIRITVVLAAAATLATFAVAAPASSTAVGPSFNGVTLQRTCLQTASEGFVPYASTKFLPGGYIDNANGMPLYLQFDAPDGTSWQTAQFTPTSDHFALTDAEALTNGASGGHGLWSTGMTVTVNLQDVNHANISTASIPVNACPVGLHTDFDGNGTADIAVFRPSNGNWYLHGVATERYGSTNNNVMVHFGTQGDIPVPGDWDGDGVADVAVFRPSTGSWHLPGRIVHYGAPGDIPVPGFYTNNHSVSVAVFRPSSGDWFIGGSGPFSCIHWGTQGDIPVPGDYNGDGVWDLAVYRPSTGVWHIRHGQPEALRWGASQDIPVPAYFNGAGVTNVVTFRPSNATWYDLGQSSKHFGLPGDVPVPLDYAYPNETRRGLFRNGGWYFDDVNDCCPLHWGTRGDLPIRPML
ncbi:MAG: FG-GAP repeat domain-containing protein [Actinomycetes bacterium]